METARVTILGSSPTSVVEGRCQQVSFMVSGMLWDATKEVGSLLVFKYTVSCERPPITTNNLHSNPQKNLYTNPGHLDY